MRIVNSRAPSGADDDAVAVTRNNELDTRSKPDNDTPSFAPATYTVGYESNTPAISKTTDEPGRTEPGVTDDTTGAAPTPKQPGHTLTSPLGAVTTTSREPTTADASTDTFNTSFVDDDTDNDFTTTPSPNDTFVPATKPSPATVT